MLTLLYCLPFTDGEQRLRLLLSFAVGSLLGDAFLHLLPEAMEHTESKAPRMFPSRGLVARRTLTTDRI